MKTLLKCKGLKEGRKWENCPFDPYLICSPGGKRFWRILIKFFKENLIIVQKFRFLYRRRKSRSRTRYSIRSDFREKQRDVRSLHFRLLSPSGLQYSIHLFHKISRLPDHSHKTQRTSLSSQNTTYFAFFPDFSHLFSDSDHFFRDPWVPLTFFPAAKLVVYHIPIKIRETNNVLTQH